MWLALQGLYSWPSSRDARRRRERCNKQAQPFLLKQAHMTACGALACMPMTRELKTRQPGLTNLATSLGKFLWKCERCCMATGEPRLRHHYRRLQFRRQDSMNQSAISRKLVRPGSLGSHDYHMGKGMPYPCRNQGREEGITLNRGRCREPHHAQPVRFPTWHKGDPGHRQHRVTASARSIPVLLGRVAPEGDLSRQTQPPPGMTW